MNPFTERVVGIIRGIPPGSVMTYGQIAAEAGNPRAARQVVRVLHAMSMKLNLPWYRVVNSKGEIAIASEEGRFTQEIHLKNEGVEVREDGTIDLAVYRFIPGAASSE